MPTGSTKERGLRIGTSSWGFWFEMSLLMLLSIAAILGAVILGGYG